MREVLRASKALPMFCQKDEPIDHMFCHAFMDKNLKIANDHGISPIQKDLETKVVECTLAKALLDEDITGASFLPCAQFRRRLGCKRRRLFFHVVT